MGVHLWKMKEKPLKKSIRNVFAAASLASLIAVAGCGGQSAEFETGANGSAESGEGENPDSGDESGGEDGNETAAGEPIGATWPDGENLVAEDVFPTLKSEDQKVRVGIEGIFVTDKTMELRMVFTPEENLDEIRANVITKNQYQEVDIDLIDRENLKKYSVIEEIDGAKRYQTPSDVTARMGETVGYQVFYPAPVDDIDHVDIDLGKGLPIFEDVPLTFEG